MRPCGNITRHSTVNTHAHIFLCVLEIVFRRFSISTEESARPGQVLRGNRKFESIFPPTRAHIRAFTLYRLYHSATVSRDLRRTSLKADEAQPYLSRHRWVSAEPQPRMEFPQRATRVFNSIHSERILVFMHAASYADCVMWNVSRHHTPADRKSHSWTHLNSKNVLSDFDAMDGSYRINVLYTNSIKGRKIFYDVNRSVKGFHSITRICGY